MTFLEQLQHYFQGERIAALAFMVPVGVFLFVLAGAAMKSEGGVFGVGIAVPLVVFGLFSGGVGLGIGLRTSAQVAALEAELATSPRTMLGKELPRMRKVNGNWPILVAVWAVFVVVGMGLRFGVKADWAQGVGPALVLAGALGLLIDGFAERRARPYTAALEAQARQHGVAVD